MTDPNHFALHDCGVCFMLPAKNANTAIKIAVLQALGRPTDNPHNPRMLNYVSSEKAASYPIRIAVVRDPLDRLASFYCDKFRSKRLLPGLIKLGFHAGMTFTQTVERVANVPDSAAINAGQHFRSQSYDLCFDDVVIPNFIARFEQLPKDWRKIRKLVRTNGGPRLPDLSIVNKSPKQKPVYSSWSQVLALRRYAKDIKIFGYKR